jgi:DegV family protein with EDD domain
VKTPLPKCYDANALVPKDQAILLNMRPIAVVTDSTATVPEDLVQELNIHVVPIPLTFEGRTFYDGVDVAPGQVYRWLRASEHMPTSSAPSAGDFLRVYAAAGREAAGIASIHMPPNLSATYDMALTASRLVGSVPVRVVNCQTAAIGQGFAVLEAAHAAAAGADLDQVVARATKVGSRMNLLFTIETFEYLHRGGRIGGAAMLLGTMLQIKPVLYLADGRIEVFAKPRTKARAIQLILRQVADLAGSCPIHVAIFHADVPEEAEALRQGVAEQFNCVELYVTEFTPVMGAHTGPGILGIAFYTQLGE